MASIDARDEVIGVTEAARRFGVSGDVLRRTVDATDLATRIGRYRIIRERDLPLVELALRARGHNRPETAQGAAVC